MSAKPLEVLDCHCGRSPMIFQRADQKSWAIGCIHCCIKTDQKRTRKGATNAWNNGKAWIQKEMRK